MAAMLMHQIAPLLVEDSPFDCYAFVELLGPNEAAAGSINQAGSNKDKQNRRTCSSHAELGNETHPAIPNLKTSLFHREVRNTKMTGN